MSVRVLVTGATGFVGKAIVDRLLAEGCDVLVATRRSGSDPAVKGTMTCHFDLERPDLLELKALDGVDVIVHAAARVHVMQPTDDEEERAQRCNVEATRALAQAAVAAGVRRFVFVSSIKVYGGRATDVPLSLADPPAPTDAYGRSKLQAENLLRELEAARGLEVTIIRPPLVYGPGVRANFLRLMSLVERGVPLPLGLVDNRRSLIAVQNLADLVVTAMKHPAAAGRTWLASDGDDLSTPDLVRRMGIALARGVRLWPVPVPLLKWGGRVLGREAELSRLCDSLQVDSSLTRADLGWTPPIGIQEALEVTAKWFRAERPRNA